MRNATKLRPLELLSRSSGEIQQWKKIRDEWVGGIAPGSHLHRLFDCIPGLHFFAKDQHGRLMFASRGLRERYLMNDETEILGRTDFDLNPGSMAQSYVDDDRRLSEGEVEVIERLELWWDRQGMPDWHLVTKLALRNRDGEFHGVMGVLRRTDASGRELPVFQTVAKAVRMIRQGYSEPMSVAQIAQSCGQSVRQLQRGFKSAFGISPQEFLMKTRVLASQHLLENPSLTTARVAEECGFVDASSFIQHFRKRVGCTPTTFRRQISADD